MAYIELIVEVERANAETLSDALLEAGALSASVEDADAGSLDEQPLFGEPGGEPDQKAWRRSTITALFGEDADLDAALRNACLEAHLSEIPPSSRRIVAEQDWVRLTQAQFDPIHIGKRLWIVPSWHHVPQAAATADDSVILQLDPGLAFGTGSHPTTRLCMAWLEEHLRAGSSVIDYGCGSGILAIAASKLGANPVIGTDIDPHAISASIANAATNEVPAQFVAASDFHAPPADVVVANILSNPLKVLAPLLSDLVVPGGQLILSGILERQWQDVAAVYAPMIPMSLWRVEDGWVCLAGQRPVAAVEQTHAVRCPACATVFAVNHRQLHARDGMVRCGVCAQIFHAPGHRIETLDDEQKLVETGAKKVDVAIPEPGEIPDPDAPADALPGTEDPERPAAGFTAIAPPEASFLKPKKVQRSRRDTIALGVLAALTILTLVGQLIYLWRNDVAALWPASRPWLNAACVTLQCEVDLPAHIDSLAIVSADLQSAPQQKDTYAFTALLRNRAMLAQRLPDIELALTDAQNQVLVRRVLTPQQYLAPEEHARIHDGIAANSELPVRIMFEAPGNRATGFRSALFYP